jgi:hypothetical protein
MKKVFMILGAGLLAALLVFSCSKPNNQKNNNKPDDKEQKDPEGGGGEEGFSMDISIDGNFSEWDALTADTADGEYYIYEENSDPDYNGILRLKLASDEDNIYVYTEINYEYIYVKEDSDGPVTGGGSWTGWIPTFSQDTPGALIVYVGCDDNANAAYGARRIGDCSIDAIKDGSDGEPMWDYMGFDAFPQYYFCFDAVGNKMAFGWNQNNWPELHDASWTDDMVGKPLGDHGYGWWGDDVEGTPVSDNTVSNADTFKFSPVMSINEPASKKDVQAVKIEFAMDRSAILESGEKVKGTAVIGIFYENISQVAHQTEPLGSGKLPSGDKAVQLKLK